MDLINQKINPKKLIPQITNNDINLKSLKKLRISVERAITVPKINVALMNRLRKFGFPLVPGVDNDRFISSKRKLIIKRMTAML